MKPLTKKLMLLLIAQLILVGCGTKGPLYIPEQAHPQPATSNK
jgi:predicted small lipoprotein YifL